MSAYARSHARGVASAVLSRIPALQPLASRSSTSVCAICRGAPRRAASKTSDGPDRSSMCSETYGPAPAATLAKLTNCCNLNFCFLSLSFWQSLRGPRVGASHRRHHSPPHSPLSLAQALAATLRYGRASCAREATLSTAMAQAARRKGLERHATRNPALQSWLNCGPRRTALNARIHRPSMAGNGVGVFFSSICFFAVTPRMLAHTFGQDGGSLSFRAVMRDSGGVSPH